MAYDSDPFNRWEAGQTLIASLEAYVLALMRGGVDLKQRLEGARLDVEQMGHLHALLEFCKGNFFH